MIQHIPAAQRFHNKLGWLSTYHLFSFADYYDPANMNFGTLRVFNHDFIGAYYGFDEHPHRDAEIVTIVLKGELTHRDSMGNQAKIKEGEVQRMSAGKGVMHAEKNLAGDPVELFQLWFLPRKSGIAPSYAQEDFSYRIKQNELTLLVKGSDRARGDSSLTMYADADVYRGQFEAGETFSYEVASGRGVFVYLFKGSAKVGDIKIGVGDQIRVLEEELLSMEFTSGSELILIDTALS